MALAKPDAFAALRVVTTVKNPSLANFCAIAPPTPQRTPTGSSLSSTGLPCASNVLRPSACHFEVAPITTATGFPLVFLPPISLIPPGLLFGLPIAALPLCRADQRSVIRHTHGGMRLRLSALQFRGGHGRFSLTSSSGAAQG